ncbi:uncharacterized protein LOC129800538 isoform X6 [Phlebotomus papatasi]|uniref:uncharacterized protein LOC129800538 isoform X6 n=1 Tax=Phlebotomus papatasi TaxID=29031 RepID=UPI0024838159|nr:uncharacterized protein LOC129800538 isoform X6 [Phlebotomus papatasi]
MFYVPRLELEGQGQRILKLLPDYNIVGSQKSKSHNSIVLDDESIDGKHSLLFFNLMQNTTEILDLASESGTFVNDEKLPIATWRSLEHGQKVMFGGVKGTFLTECGGKDLRDYTPSPHEDPTVLPKSHESSRESFWGSLGDIDKIDNELDRKLDALAEPVDPDKIGEKSFKIIPETQESPLTEKGPQEHFVLPETQAPRNLSRNFDEDACEQITQIFKPLPTDIVFPDIESQNLLADFGEPQKVPEQRAVEIGEVTVIEKKNSSLDVSHQLISLDDGQETDCEEELSEIELKTPKKLNEKLNEREGSVTPELEELHQTEKSEHLDKFTIPNLPIVQLRRLNVPVNGNANVYDEATQEMSKTPYDIPTQAFPSTSASSGITQPFDRKIFPTKDPIEAYLAATQVNINPIEQRNGSILRLSEISSDDLSQSSQTSTPPCAIKLPSADDVAKFLRKHPTTLKRKASVQNLFPESSDEEDLPTVYSEAISAKTPKKELSAVVAQRLKQISILDSPDSSMFEPELNPSKAAPIRRNLSKKSSLAKEVPPKKPPETHSSPPSDDLSWRSLDGSSCKARTTSRIFKKVKENNQEG